MTTKFKSARDYGNHAIKANLMARVRSSKDVSGDLGKVLEGKSMQADEDEGGGFKVVNEEGGALGLYLSGVIGLDVNGDDVLEVFSDEANKGREVKVYIHSPGGSAFDGIDMATKLARFAPGYTAVVDGLAGSAATIIAVSGGDLVFSANTEWLVHEAAYDFMCASVKASEMRDKLVPSLDATNETIADAYARRTGKTSAEMMALMLEDRIMNAKEGVEIGFGVMAETGEDGEEEEVSGEVDKLDKVAKMHTEVSELPVAARPMQAFTKERALGFAKFFQARADALKGAVK